MVFCRHTQEFQSSDNLHKFDRTQEGKLPMMGCDNIYQFPEAVLEELYWICFPLVPTWPTEA